MSSLRYRLSARPVRLPLVCLPGLLLLTCLVLFLPAPTYGASPPVWSHTVDAHPAWTGHVAQLPAIPWLPALRLASAAGGAGVVQGHVYDYFGSPVANAAVTVSAKDDQGNWLWGQDATTDAIGAYSVSGAPATAHGGMITVGSETGFWSVKGLAFADPGPSTYDLRPARVSWSATREGRGRTTGVTPASKSSA